MQEENVVIVKNTDVFQDKNLVLANVNFTIRKGEFVYLIGRTGSGKSSLLKILYGEIPLKTGEAVVAGFPLQALPLNKVPFLRRQLGFVFQDFQLLADRSVFENLSFVLRATGWKEKDKIAERTSGVLEMVGLSTKGYKMPDELSGGEQQRVVIARALLNDPQLLLADEPTGNLDPETSYGIMELLLEISRKGRSVLMATHNYSLIDRFPARILRCENGKLLEVAKTEQPVTG